MHLPDDLLYTESHEWVQVGDDGLVTVGITDHAQESLGDIVYLELPEVGRKVAPGEECAVIESVKAASDIYAPVGGEVVAVNSEVADSPESINKDAYAAWLFRIQPEAGSPPQDLLDAEAYARIVEPDQD
jgi:glycine cleavage system H protein